MARARVGKKSSRRLARREVVTATVVAPWERNARVVRATTRILDIERTMARAVIDAVVKQGRLLAMVKELLPHGEWMRWLQEGVHFDRTRAERAIKVEAWSRKRPREFRKIRDLSISKVYRLLGLAPEQRRRLFDRRVPIPGTQLRLRIAEMTVANLDRVIKSFKAQPPPSNPVPALLEAARHNFAGLDAQLSKLIEHRDRVDEDDILEIRNGLAEAIHRIDTAFEL